MLTTHFQRMTDAAIQTIYSRASASDPADIVGLQFSLIPGATDGTIYECWVYDPETELDHALGHGPLSLANAAQSPQLSVMGLKIGAIIKGRASANDAIDASYTVSAS